MERAGREVTAADRDRVLAWLPEHDLVAALRIGRDVPLPAQPGSNRSWRPTAGSPPTVTVPATRANARTATSVAPSAAIANAASPQGSLRSPPAVAAIRHSPGARPSTSRAQPPSGDQASGRDVWVLTFVSSRLSPASAHSASPRSIRAAPVAGSSSGRSSPVRPSATDTL